MIRSEMAPKKDVSLLVPVLLVVFMFSVRPAESSAPPDDRNISATEGTRCLGWLTSLVHFSSSAIGAEIFEIGCFSWSRLDISNISRNVTNFRSNASSPSHQAKINCAGACLAQTASPSRAQFAFVAGECFCPTTPQYQGHRDSPGCCSMIGSGASSSCTSNEIYARVFQLTLMCRLDPGRCAETPRCQVREGCCVPDGSVDDGPPIHLTLMQWMVAFILIAVVLQGIWWSVRMKMRRRSWERTDEALLNVPMRNRARPRPRELAKEQAMLAIKQFARVRTSDVDSDAHCGICLEPQATSGCIKTTCAHIIHGDCLQDYLAHALRSYTNDVCCPMCRAILVVQVRDPISATAQGGSDSELSGSGQDANTSNEAPLLPQPSSVVVLNGVEPEFGDGDEEDDERALLDQL